MCRIINKQKQNNIIIHITLQVQFMWTQYNSIYSWHFVSFFRTVNSLAAAMEARVSSIWSLRNTTARVNWGGLEISVMSGKVRVRGANQCKNQSMQQELENMQNGGYLKSSGI